MSHHKVTAGAALAAAFVGLTSGQALAQDANESEIIVVTADKRETRLVDVPSTVNLIDGEALDAARIDNLDNLATIVPGLEYTASGSSQLAYPSLRGVSPQVFGDPTVTVFQDGVALGSSVSASKS
jgi:iron complex outermembrane receptor protein